MEKAMWQRNWNLEIQSRWLWRWRKKDQWCHCILWSSHIFSLSHHDIHWMFYPQPFLSSDKQKMCKITVIIKNIWHMKFWSSVYMEIVYDRYRDNEKWGREWAANSSFKGGTSKYKVSHGLTRRISFDGKGLFPDGNRDWLEGNEYKFQACW